MPKLSGKDLAALYPEPKSFDELETERQHREDALRPRFVPLKISLLTTLGIAVALLAYELISHMMMRGLSSESEVISSTCFSILLALGAGALLYYLSSLISRLAAKALVLPSRLYAAIAGVVFCAGIVLTALAEFGYVNILTTGALLLVVFAAAYFAVTLVMKHDFR